MSELRSKSNIIIHSNMNNFRNILLFALSFLFPGLLTANDNIQNREVTLSQAGTLSTVLGEDVNNVYSLSVAGPLNEDDFKTMLNASYFGNLTILNLEKAILKDNSVPDNAFYDRKVNNSSKNGFVKLKKITLPDDVVYLGENAFRFAKYLESINLPAALNRMGPGCFAYCYQLHFDKLVIPEGVTAIPERCFLSCENLSDEVDIPSSVVLIQDYAFEGCGISYINLPEGLFEIGGAAFMGSKLKEITIPSTCTLSRTGEQFSWCYELKSANLSDRIRDIPKACFQSCYALEEIRMPAVLSTIGPYAFAFCQNLKKIDLHEWLISIDEMAFTNCSSLERLVIPSTVYFLGDKCIDGLLNLKALYCKAGPTPPAFYIMDPESPYYTSPLMSNPIPRTTPLYVPVGAAASYKLDKSWEYFTNIYETNDFPDEADIDEIISQPTLNDNNIYDLMGRIVAHPQQGHIYIRAGKKFIFNE